MTRSRPIQANTANALGPTGCPVSAARLALISTPAFTPRSSASLRNSASTLASRELRIRRQTLGQFVQQFARAGRIQFLERLLVHWKIVAEIRAPLCRKIEQRGKARANGIHHLRELKLSSPNGARPCAVERFPDTAEPGSPPERVADAAN